MLLFVELWYNYKRKQHEWDNIANNAETDRTKTDI